MSKKTCSTAEIVHTILSAPKHKYEREGFVVLLSMNHFEKENRLIRICRLQILYCPQAEVCARSALDPHIIQVACVILEQQANSKTDETWIPCVF